MSILIKGMEMPKRGHTTTITIVGSGQAYVEYFDCRPHVEETIEYAAVPVPPHGRLIDVDKVLDKLAHNLGLRSLDYLTPSERAIVSWFRDAPTIFPADPAEEGE